MESCDYLGVVGTIASILGLIIGIIGTSFYYKVIDKSKIKNNVKKTKIKGDFVGRDKNG
ncbi:hypothetical protein ACN9JV_06740 [Aliarcobacter butzleri]|uniref:hypothetical protein n=1 Tax=Aliarcobacter butzleri TaxID=28197 RepID=UPI003B21489B